MIFKNRLMGLRKMGVLLHWEAAVDRDFLHRNFLCETTLIPFRVPAFWLSQLLARAKQLEQVLNAPEWYVNAKRKTC